MNKSIIILATGWCSGSLIAFALLKDFEVFYITFIIGILITICGIICKEEVKLFQKEELK